LRQNGSGFAAGAADGSTAYGDRPDDAKLAFVRICSHYFAHDAFLEDGGLIRSDHSSIRRGSAASRDSRHCDAHAHIERDFYAAVNNFAFRSIAVIPRVVPTMSIAPLSVRRSAAGSGGSRHAGQR
jgi:hypothetical protein